MTASPNLDPKMELVIHRGTQQIGGSCVEVRAGRTRVFLDAGLPLPPLEEDLPPNEPSLPTGVRGLFDDVGPPADALLLSHAHGDHVGLLPHVRADVPIFLTKETSQMLMAGSQFTPNKWQLPRNRERKLKPGQTISIGDLEVTPLPVDHSVPGACAFLIEHGGVRLLYSGDLRMHGPDRATMETWLQHPEVSEPDVLVMEGTLLGQPGRSCVTEEAVSASALEAIREANGLVLLMFSPQNAARLYGMLRAVCGTGRSLVCDPYTLFVLHLLKARAGAPDPLDPALNLRVWFHNRSEARQAPLFRNIAHALPRLRISLKEVLAAPDRHALIFRARMADEHPAILDQAKLAIYSYWQGYEQQVGLRSLKQRMADKRIRWLPLHASGHIHHEDLVAFVRQLKPRMLVPIHTERGDDFAKFLPDVKVKRLEDGMSFVCD